MLQALKSYSTELMSQHKPKMFEHILNLTLELVTLATHRDLFMCLLTLNSRKFLIEIVEQFSEQIPANDTLIHKYAELLNLLDEKEVFAYKTAAATNTSTPTTPLGSKESSQSPNPSSFPHFASSLSSSLTAASTIGSDEASWLIQRYKEIFYDVVYRFPHDKYLKERCLNNCVDYHIQRKLVPSLGNEAIVSIERVLWKYLRFACRADFVFRIASSYRDIIRRM